MSINNILDDTEVEEYEKDELQLKFDAIKRRIYQAAKDGFSINLCSHLNKIDSLEVKNIIVNQVSA
jgi:hypothetical protein